MPVYQSGGRTQSSRPSFKTFLLCCMALITVNGGVHAQEDNGLEPYRLSPIIVNAKAESDDDANSIVARELWVGGKVATSILDTPASVSVITDKEIESRDANTTEEVLQYTPGIITDFFGTDDRNDYFQIRGFQATTYRDGLTLGSMRGVREEPFAYERVEVIRGANSTLFGPADPGGSVNFVTKKPKFERFGNAYLTYGSFEHAEAGVDFGDTLNADGSLAYRFTGIIRDSELEYDYSRNDENFVMGGLSWEPTDHTLVSLIVDHLNRDGTPNSGGYPLDREYSRSNFFGEPDFNYHDVERTSVTAFLTHDFGAGLTLRSNVRYSDLSDDFAYVYLFDFIGRTGTVLDRYYFGTDTNAEELIGNVMLQYDTSFGEFDSSTLLGVEYRNASTDDTSIFGLATPIDISNPVFTGGPSAPFVYDDSESDYTTRSAFLQQNFSFYDRFITTVGVRHDWLDLKSKGTNFGTAFDDSDDFSETSIRGALTYKITEQVSSYISYVESVAPPSIGISPERGEQYEFGVKYAPAGINALFSASIYELTKKDVTIAVVQSDGRIERETVGESRVRGFDLEGKAELTETISILGGYSYIDSEVIRGTLRDGTSLAGNEFTSTPKHIFSLWANYTVPGSGLRGDMTFGLGARYLGSYYFDAANTGKSDATTIYDASFTYQIVDNADLAINVSNLFDEQHVVGSGTADYYNPGREITTTLNYRW